MSNLSQELLHSIADAMRRTEGSVEFVTELPGLFDPQNPGMLILQIPAGAHLFRIERDANMHLNFYHSSPGVGTRVATIDLHTVPASQEVFLGFAWSPQEITLHVGAKLPGAQLISASGYISAKQFRVTKDGHVVQLGDKGEEILGARIHVEGFPVLQPTALNAWQETLNAISFLQDGKSDAGYIYEVVISNLTLSTLVTGFETYCKTRFIEIEQEGIIPNIDGLTSAVFTPNERDADLPSIVAAESKETGTPLLEKLAARVNFQNYDQCKKVYGKTYGIKFGELELSSDDISVLKKLIKYPHRIIHVSPLIGFLNQ